MSATRSDRRNEQPRWVTAWFILDTIVALAPPLYWAFDGAKTPILVCRRRCSISSPSQPASQQASLPHT